jgi:lipopolysaccharide exporter
MGYFSQTIKGLTWSAFMRGLTRIFSIVRVAILARLLLPSQFGVFGIASLVLTFIETITETGINIFLIQERDDYRLYVDSAWIVSITRGIVIALAMLITAPFIAYFFHSPQSYNLIVLASAIPFLRGFINPSVIQFQKELKFDKEFYYRTIILFVESLAAIILAFATRSAISMVWALIVSAGFEMCLSFIFIRPLPKFSFNSDLIKKVFHRGKWLTLNGIFIFLFENGDDFVVGKLLNTTALGIYQMAYTLSLLPITEISEVISNVIFPVFTKITHDKKRLLKAFTKTTLSITLLTVPFGIILAVFAKEIILLLLGAKWLGAVSILQILAAYGVLRAISGSATSVFYAVKKQEIVTWISITGFLLMAVTVIPFIIKYGLNGAGYSVLFSSIVVFILIFYYIYKIFNDDKIWKTNHNL